MILSVIFLEKVNQCLLFKLRRVPYCCYWVQLIPTHGDKEKNTLQSQLTLNGTILTTLEGSVNEYITDYKDNVTNQ